MRARKEPEATTRQPGGAVTRPAEARRSAVGPHGPLSSADIQRLQLTAGNAVVARMVAARDRPRHAPDDARRPGSSPARPAPSPHSAPADRVVQRAGDRTGGQPVEETGADRGTAGGGAGTGLAASGPAGMLGVTADHAAMAGGATVGGHFSDPTYSTPTSYATGTGAPFGSALAAAYGAVRGVVDAVRARRARGRAVPGSAEQQAADAEYRTARADAAQDAMQAGGQVLTGAGGAMNQSGNFTPAAYSEPLAAGTGVGVVTGGLQAGRFLRKALRANERAVGLRKVIDQEESSYEGYQAQVNAAYRRVELLREAVDGYRVALEHAKEAERSRARRRNPERSSKQRVADLHEELYGGPMTEWEPGGSEEISATRRARISELLDLGAESSDSDSGAAPTPGVTRRARTSELLDLRVGSSAPGAAPTRGAPPAPLAPDQTVEEPIDVAEVSADLQRCQRELDAARETLREADELRRTMQEAVRTVIGQMERYANGDTQDVTLRDFQRYAEEKNKDGRRMKLATAIAGATGASASVASLVATAAVAAGATAGAGALAATPLGWALAGVAAVAGAGIAGRKTLHLFKKRWEQTKPENTGEERLSTWRHLGRTLRFWRETGPNERREYARLFYEAVMAPQQPPVQAERIQNTLDVLGISRERLSGDPEVAIALIARKVAS